MKQLVPLSILLFSSLVMAQQLLDKDILVKQDEPVLDGLAYLNDLRLQAGMIPFRSNDILSAAAKGHADYLYQHRQWGHNQQWGRRGFTGSRPLDRMLAAGYLSRHNSENVSSHTGRATPKKSINGLMSAIYHRFGFLSFDYNEIGVGNTSDGKFHSYVYDMGNSKKVTLCEERPQSITTGQYLYKVCLDESRKIKTASFEQALKTIQLENTGVVVWPPNDGENVPPAFYEESPDPLPGYDVSGYPVSVQFNPAIFKNNRPLITRFELFLNETGEQVKVIKQLNKNTDPNRKFSDFEFAIFPENRLDWNTLYRTEVEYLTPDHKTHKITWTFRTAGFDVPLYKVSGSEVIYPEHETFAVYSPPTSRHDAKSEYQVSYRQFKDVKVKILDAHTLIITPIGNKGRATFSFHGKKFTVVKQ